MPKHTDDSLQRILKDEWPDVGRREIDHGLQFTLPGGTKVNFFLKTGKIQIQGKDTDEKKRAEELLQVAPSVGAAKPIATPLNLGLLPPEKVFIVYGHDTDAREQLELLLRRLKLEPVILANLVAEGQTIIEMLEKHGASAKYACVLLTPDDEGHRRDKPDEKRYRARQNVVLELGMFLLTLGRKRVAILHKGEVELPSDIHGLVYIPFQKHVSEVKERLAAELQGAGFHINIKDLLAN